MTISKAGWQTGVVALGVCRGLVRLLGRAWRWPDRMRTAFWRTTIDNPAHGVLAVLLGVELLALFVLLAISARTDDWGRRLQRVWDAEAAAPADQCEAYLEREKLKGLPVPDHVRSDGRLLLEGEWHPRWDPLTKEIEKVERGIPSLVSPLGPYRGFAAREVGLAIVYHLDHFLFGSTYPLLLLGYLALGIPRGWEASMWRQLQVARSLPPWPPYELSARRGKVDGDGEPRGRP